MARFKVDENLPVEAAKLLADAGHDASTVPEQNLSGQSDSQVARACRDEGRAIVTLDLDFADIRVYPPADYSGIIVFRLARMDKPGVLTALNRLLPLIDQEALARKLWIVEESCVRIRG